MKKSLVALVGSVLMASSCSTRVPYSLEGEVLSERYIQPKLEESQVQSLTGGGRTMAIGDSKYILNVKASNGKTYILSIMDGPVPKEALDDLIDVGSIIKFKVGCKEHKDADTFYYSYQFDDTYGELSVRDIEVLR